MSHHDIEAREQEFLVAFNGGDAAALASFYADGARIFPPGSDAVSGREAIEAFFEGFVAMKTQLSFQLLAVHESPDLCAAIGAFEMELHPPGGGTQHNLGKYVEVWKRQPDGCWRIVEDIFNSTLPS